MTHAWRLLLRLAVIDLHPSIKEFCDVRAYILRIIIVLENVSGVILKFMNHGIQHIQQPAVVTEKRLINEHAHYVYRQIKQNGTTKRKLRKLLLFIQITASLSGVMLSSYSHVITSCTQIPITTLQRKVITILEKTYWQKKPCQQKFD